MLFPKVGLHQFNLGKNVLMQALWFTASRSISNVFDLLLVCNWGVVNGLHSKELGKSPKPSQPESFMAASPRCFPYTITKLAIRDTAVGIWSALERGNWDQHSPERVPRGHGRSPY